MRCKLCLVWLMVGALAVLSAAPMSTSTAAWAPLQGYNPDELSYGLYWFGLGGVNQKSVSGEPNPYFDPARPTLIFVHGWQPFLSNNLPNFAFGGTDTAAAWINDGWNVGIFVWNQFSDETTGVSGSWFSGGSPPQGVTDAEAKVWTPNGPRGMRWRDWNDYIDGYGDPPPGTPSAGELFYRAYVAALENEGAYTGGVIRVAGHSLGNQMAVRLTRLVHDSIAAGETPERLRPTRVALLDPYWSPGGKSYLGGRTTGDVAREYIAELLPTGTLFEWYWSSTWTDAPEGDSNDDLKPMTLYAEMDPDYAADDKDRHLAAQHLYFWSYAFDSPAACVGEECLAMTRVLAKMSDAQLAAVMRSDYRWTQTAGQSTATPADDVYQSALQAGAPYTVTALQAVPPTQTVGGVITVTATVPAADGVLVSFAADLGEISARAAVSDGAALAHITSDVAGTAHISATARGTGGVVQRTLTVTFTGAVSECTPISEVAIAGPVGVSETLYVDTLYTFDAVVTPSTATLPITYTWAPTPTNGQNHSIAAYQWTAAGTYTIALTVENCGGALTAEPRVIHVTGRQWRYIYLPLLLRNHTAGGSP